MDNFALKSDGAIAIEELGNRSAISDDDARLLAMGKKPELRRVYNFWSCMCFRSL